MKGVVITILLMILCINASLALAIIDTAIIGTAETVILRKGTTVTLELLEVINSDKLDETSIIPLAIGLDVVVEGKRVAITGAYATAKVSRLEPPRSFGKGAFLEIEANGIQLIDGQFINVAGSVSQKRGKNRKGLAWALAILTPGVGAIFAQASGNGQAAPFMLPFAGLGLMVKGGAAEIPAATTLHARVTRDTPVQVVE